MTNQQKQSIRLVTDFVKSLTATAGMYQCEDGARLMGNFARGMVNGEDMKKALVDIDGLFNPCPDAEWEEE